MLHLVKLAVGVRDVAQLRAAQAERAAWEAPLRHRTRHMPKRHEEIVAGGSLYWVIGGVLQARQRLLGIVAERSDDGSKLCSFLLDGEVVRVEGRPLKAFQGWRYLEGTEVPADVREGDCGADALPAELRNELRVLCLI